MAPPAVATSPGLDLPHSAGPQQACPATSSGPAGTYGVLLGAGALPPVFCQQDWTHSAQWQGEKATATSCHLLGVSPKVHRPSTSTKLQCPGTDRAAGQPAPSLASQLPMSSAQGLSTVGRGVRLGINTDNHCCLLPPLFLSSIPLPSLLSFLTFPALIPFPLAFLHSPPHNHHLMSQPIATHKVKLKKNPTVTSPITTTILYYRYSFLPPLSPPPPITNTAQPKHTLTPVLSGNLGVVLSLLSSPTAAIAVVHFFFSSSVISGTA